MGSMDHGLGFAQKYVERICSDIRVEAWQNEYEERKDANPEPDNLSIPFDYDISRPWKIH